MRWWKSQIHSAVRELCAGRPRRPHRRCDAAHHQPGSAQVGMEGSDWQRLGCACFGAASSTDTEHASFLASLPSPSSPMQRAGRAASLSAMAVGPLFTQATGEQPSRKPPEQPQEPHPSMPTHRGAAAAVLDKASRPARATATGATAASRRLRPADRAWHEWRRCTHQYADWRRAGSKRNLSRERRKWRGFHPQATAVGGIITPSAVQHRAGSLYGSTSAARRRRQPRPGAAGRKRRGG